VQLTALPALEEQLFEDHAAILDHFLSTFSSSPDAHPAKS
jgi:hypothetical protein